MELSDLEMGQIVLYSTVHNQHYASKVIPYLSETYFTDDTERAIAETILNFHKKYHKSPNNKEIVVEMKDRKDVNTLDRTVIQDVLSNGAFNVTDNEWLIDKTEKYIRRRRVSLAFEKTYGEFEKGESFDDIANVFQDALTFSFDNTIGHSFTLGSDERWESYTSESERVSLMMTMMDKVTGGGVSRGTLNCYVAGTGVNL